MKTRATAVFVRLVALFPVRLVRNISDLVLIPLRAIVVKPIHLALIAQVADKECHL